MSGLTDKLRSRAHWRTVIRPGDFRPDRLSYEALATVVQSVQVRMRGWYVPHFSEPLQYGTDWIGYESQFEHHFEAWRFYTSGQFVDLIGVASEWRDESSLHPAPPDWKPSARLPVWEPLFMFTEIFELAARLALSPAGADLMVVGIEARHIQGMQLVVDDPGRAEFFQPYVASINSFPFEASYSREELITSARKEAVRATRELVLRFGWTAATEELLAGYQQQLVGGDRS